jgi:hypothetical protein
MSLEERVVRALRLENASKVDEEKGWELWKYGLRDPASQTKLPEDFFLLFIKSKGLNKSDLPQLNARLHSSVGSRKLSVAVQRSSPFADNLEQLRKDLRAQSVKLMFELLQGESRHLLGSSQNETEQFPYFVEPIVDDKLALTKLGRWLMADREERTDEDEPSVAVLLAPAGVGKTSVARELTRALQAASEHRILPLLIEPSQWSSLNPNETPSLWSLIKHALEASGHNAVSQDSFELFAQTGCIVTIFDGLDELGSVRGATISPVDVIDQLRKLSEESDCRVLLTSRDGLWSEMVPLEFRMHVREFKLLPFRKDQIARYREKRFPNPNKPERARFDEILEAVTIAAHPTGTAKTPYEERAPAAPLILHLVATEAEEYSDGAKQYGIESPKYRNPLYAITYGILNREHSRRNLRLTPAQQFMMISTLVVDMGNGPYSSIDVRTAAEYAMGSSLKDGEDISLKSHPLLRPTADGTFVFRFEYLAKFAPAVWLCEYLMDARRDSTVEKYLASIAGRSSPVSAFVAELMRESAWESCLKSQVSRLKVGDSDLRATAPFIWEVAQSLLPPPGNLSRVARTDKMREIFGEIAANRIEFSGLLFSGPIPYMDFRGTLFNGCTFQNCEWINCEAGPTTEFLNCTFKGRFSQIQSSGLRSAIYNPLAESNVDLDARADLERLLNKPNLLSTTREAIIGMLTTLLEQFRPAGFFVPRSHEQLSAKLVGPAVVRDCIIEQLIANAVLETHTERGLLVHKKHSASITALLDNGTLNGAVRSAAMEVINRFNARQ